MALQIRTIVSLSFSENSYIVSLPNRHDAVVIDPGLDPQAILQALAQDNQSVAAILNTHGHADHIAGNGAIKQAFPTAPLVIGAADASFLTDPEANLSSSFGMPIASPPADRVVRQGDTISAAGIVFAVVDLPGHSPGHVAYLCQGDPAIAFDGDVLFKRSIGRSDFPGGDGELLLRSIRERLLTLPPNTIIYPGHGPATTIGAEQESNPFLR
jgi:glyoxylase-like metal-dependent hydrolase (beta-lactamase superfamily II)